MKNLSYSIVTNISSLPTAGIKGRLAILTTDNSLYYDNGSSWINVGAPTSGLGTMSTQNATAVAITGGTITGVVFSGGVF